MHLFKLSIQRQNHISLHHWVYISVIQILWLVLRALILLPCLDLSQILLRQQINNDLILLLLLESSKKHLDEYTELFEVDSFIRNLFDVLLFVVPTPDKSLSLRFHVKYYAHLRVKRTDSVDR